MVCRSCTQCGRPALLYWRFWLQGPLRRFGTTGFLVAEPVALLDHKHTPDLFMQSAANHRTGKLKHCSRTITPFNIAYWCLLADGLTPGHYVVYPDESAIAQRSVVVIRTCWSQRCTDLCPCTAVPCFPANQAWTQRPCATMVCIPRASPDVCHCGQTCG